jgi:hypothetical protein
MTKRKKVPLTSKECALEEFCDVIDDAGGLKYSAAADELVLVEDETWGDLVDAYRSACRALGREPKIQKKYVRYDVKLSLLVSRGIGGVDSETVLDFIKDQINITSQRHPYQRLHVTSIRPVECDSMLDGEGENEED